MSHASIKQTAWDLKSGSGSAYGRHGLGINGNAVGLLSENIDLRNRVCGSRDNWVSDSYLYMRIVL